LRRKTRAWRGERLSKNSLDRRKLGIEVLIRVRYSKDFIDGILEIYSVLDIDRMGDNSRLFK
jgi:hypothetical protein